MFEGGKNKNKIIAVLAIFFVVSGIFGIVELRITNYELINGNWKTCPVYLLNWREIVEGLEIGNLENQKTAEAAALGGLRLTQEPGLSSWKEYSILNKFVKDDSDNTVEMRGIEPRIPWMISQVLDQPIPTANLSYHKINDFQNKNIDFGDLVRGIFGVKTVWAQSFHDAAAAVQRKQAEADRKAAELKKQADEKIKAARKSTLWIALRAATRNVVQQFAYRAAEYVAEGGEGKEGLGWDIPYAEYLSDAGESALGDFIGSMSDIWGVDLCDPGQFEKINITLDLIHSITQPPKPRCDWSEINSNWEKLGANWDEGKSTQKLADMFQPKVSYLGSTFALQDEIRKQMEDKKTVAEKIRGWTPDYGFKDIRDPISGWIKTSRSTVQKMAEWPMIEDLIERLESTMGSYIMGDILAPAVTTFTSTLTGKLLQKWTNEGMFLGKKGGSSKLALTNPEAAGTTAVSQADIKKMYGDIIKPTFETVGNYDILSDLASCPFPEKPSPQNCVIDTEFRRAIEDRLTVGEASSSDKGYLKKDWTFGFIDAKIEPAYNEGYPYRSMVILRKYRILPVGWEIAASYIQKYGAGTEKGKYTLGDLVACYDLNDEWRGNEEEWCRGMVDPGWLLKVPATNCEKQAYGQEIISDIVMEGADQNKDGLYYNADATTVLDDNDYPPRRNVGRNKSCAVDKTCLQEGSSGGCLKWGYCTEEMRIWKFEGEGCDPQFNSCQEYTRINANATQVMNTPVIRRGATGQDTNQRESDTVAYLKNTLDYGVCGPDNAGCMWYCSEYDRAQSDWSCNANVEGNTLLPNGGAIFFDKDVEECEEEEEGCHQFIRITDQTNLLYNGGFEFGDESVYIYPSQTSKFNGWPIVDAIGSYLTVEKVSDTSNERPGSYFYHIQTDGENGIYSYDRSNVELSVMPDNYTFDYNKNYVLSAYVKAVQGNVEIGMINDQTSPVASLAGGELGTSARSTLNNKWEQLILYWPAEKGMINKIYVKAIPVDGLPAQAGKADVYIDDLFLTEHADSTRIAAHNGRGYIEYGNESVYVKKAPDRLGCKETNPDSACADFAVECAQDQVGCKKWTPVNGDPWIPSIDYSQDRCDLECVNYKSYKESATVFSRERLNINFIAESPYLTNSTGIQRDGSTGKECSANFAGCSEFTNLDELEKGGEALEYYTNLKQCVKPNDPGVSCGTFYTWIGSDTTGYQLKEYYLQKGESRDVDGDGQKDEVAKEINSPINYGECASKQDAINNSAYCKEFYNEAGKVFYAVYPEVITCSEECRPYRKTREPLNYTECLYYGSIWITSPEPGVCQLEIDDCVNSGGIWDNAAMGCNYKAIPREGNICSANEVGCREYKGTTGSNIKTIFQNDFEHTDNIGWDGGAISSRSIYFSGHSLTLAAGAVSVKTPLTPLYTNKTYSVSFMANYAASGNKNIEILLQGSNFIALRRIAIENSDIDDWKIYNLNIAVLTGDLNENGIIDNDAGNTNSDMAILDRAIDNPMSVTARQRDLADIDGDGIITGKTDKQLLQEFITSGVPSSQIIEIRGLDANTYVDNFIVKEVQENFYRIKNSWTVPEKCDSPMNGWQLNCEEYEDMEGGLVQLKSFSRLCPSDAVGCEKMIDTYNSASVFKEVWDMRALAIERTPVPEGDYITIPRDRVVYFVNNPDKYCSVKGCQKFGVPSFNQDKTAVDGYDGEVYFVNDPDVYGNILCQTEAMECMEFKNTNNGSSVYFKDPGDKLCQFIGRDPSNPASTGWIKIASGGEQTTESCPAIFDINLTLNSPRYDTVYVPTDGWVGICPEEQSGCREYMDPLSNNSPNLVRNGGFDQDIEAIGTGIGNGPDEWSSGQFVNLIACDINCVECCNSGYGGTKAIQKGKQTIYFEYPGLYTLSARVSGTGQISISGCELKSPDNSMVIEGTSAKIVFTSMNAMQMRSGRFYLYGPQLQCDLIVDAESPGGYVDEANVQETGVYYHLAQDINTSSCNGKVDFNNGCVLLNEREVIGRDTDLNITYASPTYSVDATYNGGTGLVCDQSQMGSCSANLLAKVNPDRTCGKWLTPLPTSLTLEAGGIQEIRSIGECVAFDKTGACARRIYSEKSNINFNLSSVSLMKDVSGLAKVGFEWPFSEKVEGYYPIGSMREIGQYVDFNGGFEKATDDGRPIDWVDFRQAANPLLPDWDRSYFEVLSNPSLYPRKLDDIKDKSPAAPEGKNILKIDKSFGAMSKELSVSVNAEYVLSGYVNTLKILTQNTFGAVYLVFYDSDKNEVDPNSDPGTEISLKLEEGNDWTFLASRFVVTNSKARVMRLKLINSRSDGQTSEGSSYFDDISIRPALEIQTPPHYLTGERVLGVAPSICKAFPREDSLSCEYTGDNGVFYQGERGYCLEYDRAPGDPKACISWFPIDVIQGGRDETLSLFNNGEPLFYCAEAQLLEYRKSTDSDQRAKNCSGECWMQEKTYQCKIGGGYGMEDVWCYPDRIKNEVVIQDPKFPCLDSQLCAGWFRYGGPEYYEGKTLNLVRSYNQRTYYEDLQIRCSKIVQVAALGGESKPWFDRIRVNSDYQVSDLKYGENNYSYSALNAPYGAIKFDGMSDNPEDWDGDISTLDKKEPLIISKTTEGVKISAPQVGLPYSAAAQSFILPEGALLDFGLPVQNNIQGGIDRLKSLFAESYGSWQWDDKQNKYVPTNSLNSLIWGPPNCCSGVSSGQCGVQRPAGSGLAAEFCAIPPNVSNLKIQEEGDANVLIGRIGSVLMKFNSNIDPNQLPLSGYEIDWVDGTYTTANELRIMPQPHENNPHSFNHPYDFARVAAEYKNNNACLGLNDNSPALCCININDSNLTDAVQQSALYGACDAYNKGSCCFIKPRVRIKDNWAWCSDGVPGHPCPVNNENKWTHFGAWIVMTESQ